MLNTFFYMLLPFKRVMDLGEQPAQVIKSLPMAHEIFPALQAAHGGDALEIAVNADGHTHQSFVEYAHLVHFPVNAGGVELLDLGLQINPKRMQCPA